MSEEKKDSFAESLGVKKGSSEEQKDDFLKGLKGEREVIKVTSKT
ncbi:hypothetical protein [Alkalibacillus silvisoli]|uniref:Uncharacterized protein n=1 Tax=Alkalibacillus silvisoli TaxID=392823 RepID=A0ABP3K6I5_9BACI